MTIQQIRQSWQQGATKGASPAHKNFPDEMSKKTVISRACKLFISSSDDSSLFDDDDKDERTAASKQAIADNANREEITMDVRSEVVEEKKAPPVKQPEPVEAVTEEPVISEGAIPGF
jgi:recombination protein RecT